MYDKMRITNGSRLAASVKHCKLNFLYFYLKLVVRLISLNLMPEKEAESCLNNGTSIYLADFAHCTLARVKVELLFKKVIVEEA